MINVAFRAAFEYSLKNEGGFVNDPADTGGPTKWGITLKTLTSWRGSVCTVLDIQNLTVEEAMDIYYSRYWLVAGCDRMNYPAISTAIFDMSVVMGPQSAVLWAQIAINEALPPGTPLISEDGVMGPRALLALARIEPEAFLQAYHSLLLKRLADIIKSHPTDIKFQNGWNNRVDRLLTLLPPKRFGAVS